MLIEALIGAVMWVAAGSPPAQAESAQPIATKPEQQQPPPPPPDQPRDPDAPIEEPDDAGGGVRFVWRQHPSIRFGRVARVDFQAKLQEDAHASYPGARDPNADGPLRTLELHRNRFGIQGHVLRRIEYELEYELTEQELSERDIVAGVTPKSKWKDVYVNLTYVNDAQIQIGKFKIPFGLDQLTGVTNNDFIYRSLDANALAPARDIGAMVHGRFFRRGLNYWAGVFRHDGDNARSRKIQGGNETVAGRLTGTPLRKVPGLATLEIGAAFTVSELSDDSFRPNGLRGRTLLTQDTFFEPVYVKGRRRRWEADVDWTAGPVGARAEYTLVTDDRLEQSIGGDDLVDARARAWYVSGTWAITGERKTRPIQPDNGFLQGGIGAVELAARYERLWFDSIGSTDEPFRNNRADNIYPNGDKALTLGVNWTLNRFIKLQFNAIREQLEDPQRNPVLNGAVFWSRVARLQFVL